MNLESLLAKVAHSKVIPPQASGCHWSAKGFKYNNNHYSNSNKRLGIDFRVTKLNFEQLQTMDSRLVTIAPGACNEKHRHAHESIFVLLSGQAEILIDEQVIHLEEGGVAYVPRWVIHQSRNTSIDQPLQLLAITDFGLTSALLGDYDSRTRLKAGGADAFAAENATFPHPSSAPGELPSLPSSPASYRGSRLKGGAPARDQGSPAQYVEDLTLEALQHRAVNHPYLEAMARGAFPSLHWALADFAEHYYGYSSQFPRYLTALISRMEEPNHRKVLLDNLMEESGQYDEAELEELKRWGVEPNWIIGVPHPELFNRFRNAIGVSNIAAADDHIEVVCWREQFLAILNGGTAAQALGALGLGTETIVQTIYQPFVDAIAKLGTLKPEDAVFFPLHTTVDDHHQATLKAIATEFAATPEGRVELAKGMRKALALRDSFWSWLYERAMAA